MARKRMFSNEIIDNDKFLDMPLTTQALYFHLGMKADDDGFIASPKKVIRAVNCTEDDLKLLIAKGFVIGFNSGVIVITHWYINNNKIEPKKYHPTICQKEYSELSLMDKVYLINDVTNSLTDCALIGHGMLPQNRIEQNRLEQNRKTTPSAPADTQPPFDYQNVINLFNSVCVSLPNVQKLTDKRRKAIKNASKLLGDITFDELFAIIEQSDFLTGRSGNWTGCGFDWILKPSNLTKIIEGNYTNKIAAAMPRNYEEVF